MYGIDPALLRAISVTGQRNEGRLLENLVYIELLRRGRKVEYYSDPQRKYEVDFVCGAEGGGVELVQVCLDPSPAEVRERELRGLRSALGVFKRVKPDGVTVITGTRGGEGEVSGRRVRFVPAYEWLLGEYR